jgi:predicted permease
VGRVRYWLFRKFFHREVSELETEIDEEFRIHKEMKAEALRAKGMSAEKAQAIAIQCFGDPEKLREDCVKGLLVAKAHQNQKSRIDWLRQDLKDGARQFLRRPGFALLAAGTLAVGLATSTAVFTYVNAYQRPLPGADSEDLYQLFQGTEEAPFGSLSYPDYQDLLDSGLEGFQVAATLSPQFAATVRHETLTEVVFGQGVTGDLFPLLRVEMSLGRTLSHADDEPDAPPSVVISHRYWSRRYGMDEGVIGRTILLNNRPHSIVGVAGPEFVGSISAFRPDIWLSFGQYKRVYWARTDREVNREIGSITPFLRLAGDEDLTGVREALSVLAGRLDLEAPLEERTRRFQLEPATWIHPAVRRAERPLTRVMLIAAAGLLLLACANVANLVLSSGARRRPEMALRSAMGASRWRLVRQLLVENLLLCAAAGAMALVLAGPTAARLSSYFAQPSVWGANVAREIQFDGKVLAFGCLAALLAALLTGVLPALKSSGKNLVGALKSGGRWASEGARSGRRRPLVTRDLLVSAQLALTVALLFVAGLVLRTLDSARNVDPGFDTEWTLASYISTSSMGTPMGEREAFFDDIIRRFQELPWVRGAAVSEQAPLSPHPSVHLRVQGLDDPVQVTVARVVPGFMETMEMEVVAGRAFMPTDTVDNAGVVIVNETLANRMAGNGNPVGQQVWDPGSGEGEERAFEVIGVVRDVRQTNLLGDPSPVAYFSLPQHLYSSGNAFLLKVMGDPAAAVSQMETELHAVDPRIAIVNILPYSDVVGGFLYPQRMNAELFTIIAILGLILSAAGVFGVTSLAVMRMQKEIGIRIAIGAGQQTITRLVVSRVARSVVLGLGIGIALALAGSRLVESLLWGVSPTDTVAIGLGLFVLLLSVILAVSLPVRRAVRVDPVETLQAE